MVSTIFNEDGSGSAALQESQSSIFYKDLSRMTILLIIIRLIFICIQYHIFLIISSHHAKQSQASPLQEIENK